MGEAGASALFQKAAAIARAGRPEDGVRFIEEAARTGDRDAALIVAHWLLYGADRPRDCAGACRLLERVASAEALRLLAHLTASGTGCEADPDRALRLLREAAKSDSIAAGELALLEKAAPKEPAREQVSADPHIEIFRSLLSEGECGWLMSRAEPLLKPSLVDDGGRGIGRLDPIRTSHGAAFVPHEADLVVQAITSRIAAVTATEAGCAEALYVMRYSPGQQYRPHLDWLPGLRNQREWTAIVYLNQGFQGGATAFPRLGLSLRLGAGDMILFRNSDGAQSPDHRLLHAGEPVTAGEKWVATRWIRHAPHDPYDCA